MKIVVAVTGASGVIYAYTLLKALKNNEVFLVISEDAKTIIQQETDLNEKDFLKLVANKFENSDLAAPIASGSHKFDSMVIVPCSGTTLSKITLRFQ